MRKLLVVVLALCAVSLVAEERRTYLIQFRSDAPFGKGALLPGEEVTCFTHVSGCAADLTDREVAAVRLRGDVLLVEEDQPRYLVGAGRETFPARALAAQARPQVAPHGIEAIRALALHKAGYRGKGVVVFVFDTGVRKDHPDLQGRVVAEINVLDPEKDAADDNGHGTHVAGTIAANDNALGVLGVAPEAEIAAVKLLNANGRGSSRGVITGIDAMLALCESSGWKGKRCVGSLSLGATTPSSLEEAAFERAAAARIPMFAAAGNHEDGEPSYVLCPACYKSVLAVAAVDDANLVPSFSNFGPQVGVAAPGVAVLSTFLPGKGRFGGIETSTGPLRAAPMDFAPAGEVTGSLAFSGIGGRDDFPSRVQDGIAVVVRGGMSFAQKASYALDARAKAVIIVNNGPAFYTGTLQGPLPDGRAWPLVVSVAGRDGEGLREGETVSVFISDNDDYAYLSGTSMATPHVSGGAALLLSAMPSLSRESLYAALRLTAHDVGSPGYDDRSGYGVIDLEAALRYLTPRPRQRAVRR